jgi:hypothetical protein
MTSKMVKLKPNNGDNAKRDWYRHPYAMGTATGAGLIVGLGYLLNQCGPKPEPKQCPQAEPVVCEECCPAGSRKEVSKDPKQPNVVVIRCIGPLIEPICGDGEITHDESCDTKSKQPNHGCKDEKTECRNTAAGCACVEKTPIRPAPAPAPVQPAPAEKPPVVEEPKRGDCEESSAASIAAVEVPASFKKAARTGVGKVGLVPGQVVEVTYLVCPNENGEKGVYAKFVGVKGAGEKTEQVAASLSKALDGRKDPNLGIAQAKKFTQSVEAEGQ